MRNFLSTPLISFLNWKHYSKLYGGNAKSNLFFICSKYIITSFLNERDPFWPQTPLALRRDFGYWTSDNIVHKGESLLRRLCQIFSDKNLWAVSALYSPLIMEILVGKISKGSPTWFPCMYQKLSLLCFSFKDTFSPGRGCKWTLARSRSLLVASPRINNVTAYSPCPR